MTDALEQEVRELRRTLRLMQRRAERSQQTLEAFLALERRLLSCNQLNELLECLLNEVREHFNLSAVSLLLYDPEQATRNLLEQPLQMHDGCQLRFLDTPELLRKLYKGGNQLFAGEPDHEQKQIAFATQPAIESCVLLPLCHGRFMLGSINLGSRDLTRYREHLNYTYFEHLAAVIASCLENCIRQEHLRQLSSLDMLTRVSNRRAFSEQVINELSRASRQQKTVSCLFVDLDYFKQVNDNFGHLVGDQVLRQVGSFLREQVRKTDLVARYGGEEFAILLTDCDAQGAQQIASQLGERLVKLVFRSEQGQAFRISASIGISSLEPVAEAERSLREQKRALMAAADNAVYRAKHEGRNCQRYQDVSWAEA